jgi:hypothetical protein
MAGRGKGGKGLGKRWCVIISKELRSLPSYVWHAEVELNVYHA